MGTSLYFFNPGHENALHNASPYYTYPTNLAKIQDDLAYLSAWYAKKNDYVLIKNQLPPNFISSIQGLNKIPEGITISNLRTNTLGIDNVHLWGISPQSIHKIEVLNKTLSTQFKYPKWNDNLIKLSSRKIARDCLIYLQEKCSKINKNIIPIFFSKLEDIEHYVSSKDYQLLVKAPYSSAGRGLLWLPLGHLNRTERQIIHGMLKKQSNVSVEKVLDKVVDFAMEFEISEKGKCNFIAYSLFYTNNKGSYSHNFIGSQQNITNYLGQYINNQDLNTISSLLIKYIEKHFADSYSGCIGVDMMIYKQGKQYLLQPCVEINVRDNMGIIAHSISVNHINPFSQGHFYINYNKKEGEQILEHIRMQKKHPLVVQNKKINSGYLSLCPIYKDTNYRAYILINSK